MVRFFKYLFFLLLTLTLLAAVATGAGLYYLVVLHPGEEISEEYIASILGRESPVYYADGQRKMGVLFQDYHRQYITYARIPKDFINAIVAAEDDQFFSHIGIDVMGIARAMLANYKAGRIVQGGSTLTQQTAKNLFKREGRSYREKLKELLWALRLEYHHSKEKILEFYCNQFFVSGNGHGLGVAARYYFDKSPAELTLLESAFIAGSVKRPSYYNPFTARNRQQPEVVRERVDKRLGYVLGKMLKAGTIGITEYNRARVTELEFRQGKMTFALTTMMDLVKSGLQHPLVRETLDEQGISNISTSGVRIITTIDYHTQQTALYALRRHCSFLDTQLRGYSREEVQTKLQDLEYPGDVELQPLAFVFATVKEVDRKGKQGALVRLDFGEQHPEGLIDAEGLERLSTALAKYRKNRWAEVDDKDRAALLKALQPGDRVWVSIRAVDEEQGVRCDLEKYGEMQGAALVFREGAIKAMAGGLENRYFNRAIDARRLMGSTFKPFLFSAALQLGWNTVDLLDNRRDVFVFMNKPYYPRPDHNSPHEKVSMSWAGVTSENVAAVWLLYHLTDQLEAPRLRELAAKLDLAPRTGDGREESYRGFRGRIRDGYGIVVNQEMLRQAAYDTAVKQLEPDFLFDGRENEYEKLRRLHYGLGFATYRQQLASELKEKNLESRERVELQLRGSLLQNSFLDLTDMMPEVERIQAEMDQQAEKLFSFLGVLGPAETPLIPGTFVLDDRENLIYTHRTALPETWRPVNPGRLLEQLAAMEPAARNQLWQNILLEGKISLRTCRQVRGQMERELTRLNELSPYSMEVLLEIRDYRVMLGLQYLRQLGKACGIESALQPVLSYPLGANVVTLAEMVRMYETMVNGNLIGVVPEESSGEDADPGDRNGLAIIDRIELPGGHQVYTREPLRMPVFDRRISTALISILQNTVHYGTGRLAAKTVRLHSEDPLREEELAMLDLPLPLGGKTGTANQFRNAAFVGYVPVLSSVDGATLTPEDGYTVGVYTGFDDNKPMTKGSNRISGSSGALPIWRDIAQSLVTGEEVAEHADLVELSFSGIGLRYPDLGQVFVPVNPDEGGRMTGDPMDSTPRISPVAPAVLTFGRHSANGFFDPERFFLPIDPPG
ncbi:MAG: glycosyl transferase family 51 [Desulfobulbus propionicus]|nr:MAG: glycosyl transferase family 51 [Desulfobulbus propionicus]